MKKMNITRTIFSVILAAALSLLTLSKAFATMPAKAAMCETCHGEKGAKPIMDTYPKLNGQNKGYLLNSLRAYKTGKRTGGLAVVMQGQAALLSDAEMAELAEYYAKQD